MTRFYLSVGAFFFFSSFLQAQQWDFITQTNNVVDICIDGDFVWAATRNGLFKLDPASNQKKYINTTSSNLSSGYLTKVVMTPEHELWVGYNYYGAGRSMDDGDTWENYEFKSNFVRTMAYAPTGQMYLGTFYEGIYYGDGDEEWNQLNLDNSPLPNNNVIEIAFETDTADNYVWYGSRYEGLVHNDGGDWHVYNPSNSPLPYGIVTALDLQDHHVAWVGTQKGLAITDGTNWDVFTVDNSPLPNNFIFDIAIADTCAWVATHQGILHIPLATFTQTDTWHLYLKVNSDLPVENIECLAVDTMTDDLWLGTYSKGLLKFDGEQWSQYNLSTSDFIDNDIISLNFTEDSTLLLCSRGNGLGIFDGNSWDILNTTNTGLLENKINFADVDSSGNVWFAYSYNGLAKWDGEQIQNFTNQNSPLSYPYNYIHDIHIDDNDVIWLAGDKGIYEFNHHDDNWTFHEADLESGDQKVTAIEPDNEGGFWYGAAFNGIKYFNGVSYEEYDTPDGKIASTIVTDLEIDEWNNLWIATENQGLIKRDTEGNWFQFKGDGNSGLEGNFLTALQYTEDSTLWIGALGVGLYSYKLGVWDNCAAYTGCIPDGNIADITWDAKGHNLWLGTMQLGLGQKHLDIYTRPDDTLFISNEDIIFTGKFNIFPNPAIDIVHLDLEIPNSGYAILNIFSQEGKFIKEITLGFLPFGKQILDLPIDDLSTGQYYLQLRINGMQGVQLLRKE